MNWEKLNNVIAPVVGDYQKLKDGLVDAETKQKELDNRYKGLLGLIKNQVTIERLQLRDELQKEMNQNIEVIQYHKEAISLYKDQIKDGPELIEMKKEIRTEVACNTERLEQHKKLEQAFKAFIEAYEETESLELAIYHEASEKLSGIREIVFSPVYGTLSFDTGVERAIDETQPKLFKQLRVSNSLMNTVAIDRSAMPWMKRLAHGESDY